MCFGVAVFFQETVISICHSPPIDLTKEHVMLGGDDLIDFFGSADCVGIHDPACDDSEEEFLDDQEVGFVMRHSFRGLAFGACMPWESGSRAR